MRRIYQTVIRRAAVLAFLAIAAPGCVVPGSNLPAPPPLPQIPLPPGPPGGPPPPPGASDISNRRFALPLSLADAELILLETEIFALGGGRFRQIDAYNRLLDEPDARERLASLALRARPAGQLYVLCAFIALDDPRAHDLQRHLLALPDAIQMYDSDVGSRRTLVELMSVIRERQLWIVFRRLRPIPVRVSIQGQPFSATMMALVYTRDVVVDVELAEAYLTQQISGVFSGDRLLVAFAGDSAAGGVRRGSLSIDEGRGSLPGSLSPWQEGCVAVWRGPAGRPKRFALTFRVTTDPGLACRSSGTK